MQPFEVMTQFHAKWKYICCVFQLNEDELREAKLLVFANKQDLPNALSCADITTQLGLSDLRNRDVSAN